MSGPGLLKDLDEVFQNSEQRVLAAFVAIKCDSKPSGSRSRRALPKSTGKTRIICLTVKRRSKKRGFKGTLHICKLSQGRYQVRKSIKLKLLSRMEAFVDSPGQQEYLELAFMQRGFTGGEARLAFEVQSAAVRLELLGTLYTFCRTHEKRAPQVVGIDVAELESSAALRSKQTETDVGQTARSLLKEAAREEGGDALAAAGRLAGSDEDEAGGGVHPLWGQREDKQIQSLLEMVSVGAASMEELKERLEAELAALEDASVHEMLEAGPVVSRVLGELGGASRLLEDLGETLDIFDARLRHMREDIAAIEGRNNQLERHSRNNQKLLAALEGLVERLSLPDDVERALNARDITPANMAHVVAAGWDLHSRLQALSEGGSAAAAAAAAAAGDENRLPRGIAGMTAVAAQRQRLHALQRSFVDRAAAHLQEQLARVADAAVQQAAGLQGAARLRPPSHASLRRRAAELAPLLELVAALRPAATVAPREAYCQAVAGLLRKEAHGAVAELRRMAAAADAGGQQEPDLLALAKPATSDPLTSRERSFTRAPTSSQPHIATASSAASITARYREAGIVPLHEGYQLLLDQLVPLMAEEAAQCIALMFPRAVGGGGGAQGGGAGSSGVAAPAASKTVRFASGELAAATLPAPDVAGKEVQGAVASLLSGLEGELAEVFGGVRGSSTLLCLPMLGATLAWRQRVAARGPACRPVAALLEACEQRLAALLEAHFAQREAAVQRFDPRGHHILPCVLNFPLVAARMEQLLQPWPVEQAPPPAPANQQQPQQQAEGQQQGSAPSSARGAEGAARPPFPPVAAPPAAGQPPPLFLSPFESDGGGRAAPPPWRAASSSGSASELSGVPTADGGLTSDISYMGSEADAGSRRTTAASGDAEAAGAAVSAPGPPQQPGPGMQQQQQQQQSPGSVLRELADGGYDAWLRAVLAAVEAHGAADPKHGQQLRLENYAALQEGLQGLPLARAAVLGSFAGQVAALRDGALGRYIEEQADYFRFSRVLEFSRRLDEAMASAGSAEVHLQQQFQPGEVRALLATTTAGLDKKLVQVHQRIVKHLAATSPHLVDAVWDRLERVCLERWGRMEEQLRQCYSGIELKPPPAELRRWFQAAKAAGP